MKKILHLIFFSLMFVVVACKTSSCMTYGNVHPDMIGKQVINTEEYRFTYDEFKKKCKEEGISSKLSKWNLAAFKSYEDKKAIKQYFYIKPSDFDSIVANKMYKLNLIIVNKDTTYSLVIRKTTTIYE